jgi:hypothetical protein
VIDPAAAGVEEVAAPSSNATAPMSCGQPTSSAQSVELDTPPHE